tara:strand:+ start:1222 stop:1530 length:309 start_codon:yes stop_codon:yes gene_type:complete
MKNWLKEKLVNLLGLKHLYVEMQELKDKIDDVDYRLDECNSELENVEYRCDEVETETQRLCDNIDDEMHNKFEQAYSELQDQIEAFNDMVEGYTITVKLNKE